VRQSEMGAEALREFQRRYFLESADVTPKVYWQLTDNWLELAVRFVTRERGVRELKDAMSRDILSQLEQAGISVASATYEIVGLPPITLTNRSEPPPPRT